MKNPLTDALPAGARKVIYVTYAVAGLGLGSAQVGYSSAALEQPTWLVVALSIYAFLGTALGLTAVSNITPRTVNVVQEESEGVPRRAAMEEPYDPA